jgi:hypothetical protein
MPEERLCQQQPSAVIIRVLICRNVTIFRLEPHVLNKPVEEEDFVSTYVITQKVCTWDGPGLGFWLTKIFVVFLKNNLAADSQKGKKHN